MAIDNPKIRDGFKQMDNQPVSKADLAQTIGYGLSCTAILYVIYKKGIAVQIFPPGVVPSK